MSGEMPSGWMSTHLGTQLAAIRGGGTPAREVESFWNGPIPWASVKDITAGVRTGTQESITEAGLKGSASSVAPAGTVVLATRMAVGKSVRFTVDVAINQDLKALIPQPSLSADFLHLWLHAQEAEIAASATGSTVKGIRIEYLEAMPLLLPPLPEQQRIAAILASVDEAIQATQGVIDQTRRVKEGLLQDLLTRGLPGHTRFKQTEIGEIPEAWSVRQLGDIASVERGKFSHRPRNAPHLYGGKHPFVQTGDIGAADDLLVSHSQTLNDDGLSYSRTFPAGTILITIAANIGDVALTTYPVSCPDSLVGILPYSEDATWLLYTLAARKDRLDRHAPESAQKNINLQTLIPLPIAVPPRPEQEHIRDAIVSVAEAARVEERRLTLLTRLKTGLLADLLTGKVRVTP